MNTSYDLLCWCWRHKQLGTELTTTSGKRVDVHDAGLYCREDRPTFFNAKVKINGMFFVGNVQILDHASEWYMKGYDHNLAYQNVILIICKVADSETMFGKTVIPTVQAVIDERITKNVNTLMQPMTGQISCKSNIENYTTMLIRHAWLAAMQTEFLENRCEIVRSLYKETHNWSRTLFETLMIGYGFGVNDNQMAKLAKSIPLSALEHHRDDLFQIEAFIMGQAGLLDLDNIPEKYQEKALIEGYFSKLRNEYLYLAHKYSMKPISVKWNRFSNGGYGAYPHVILSMFANFYYSNPLPLDWVLGITSAQKADELLTSHSTPYWQTHNHFGFMSGNVKKGLSQNRRCMLIASAIVPFLFAYGREQGREDLCDIAFDIMDQMKNFSTPESESFSKYGFESNNASQTIALTQLQKNYCDKQNCLKCRFGFCYVKHH